MRKLLTTILLLAAVAAMAQYVRQKPKVYVEATVQLIDAQSTSFLPQLKNALRENGWIVCASREEADYLLVVSGAAREFTRPVSKEKTTHNYFRVNDSIVTHEDIMYGGRAHSQYGYYGESSAEATHEQRVISEKKDTIIDIQGKEPEEYMHFVYMESHVTLSKSDASVLYEDVLEVKEGHTLSYDEAARVAAKSTINQLVEVLQTKIKRR